MMALSLLSYFSLCSRQSARCRAVHVPDPGIVTELTRSPNGLDEERNLITLLTRPTGPPPEPSTGQQKMAPHNMQGLNQTMIVIFAFALSNIAPHHIPNHLYDCNNSIVESVTNFLRRGSGCRYDPPRTLSRPACSINLIVPDHSVYLNKT